MASNTGSATGNPRNKVALKPGHSLMDWIRLGNSGVDLSGTGGVFIDVSTSELAMHNSVDDAWICIRGKVYNVTRYLEFHPGGVEELVRGIGKDATKLFNEIHPWVNYESLLKKCIIGKLFVNQLNESDLCGSSNTKVSTAASENYKNCVVTKYDWYQQLSSITIVLYHKLGCVIKEIFLINKVETELWVRINFFEWLGWIVEGQIKWHPINVRLVDGKIEIKFEKHVEKIWNKFERINSENHPNYCTREEWLAHVELITEVTHDVYLLAVKTQEKIFYDIPVGYHLTLRANIKGVDVERTYTPVGCSLVYSFIEKIFLNNDHYIYFLIKVYPNGLFSPWIGSRKTNDVIRFTGGPQGSFNISNTFKLTNVTQLILLTAGTGFTPMITIINSALKNSKLLVKLIFFNKTEKDIIWKLELEKLASDNSRFTIDHILSEADSSWQGQKGWLTLQLLENYIPDLSVLHNENPKSYLCICGPSSFSQLAERYLIDMGYTSQNYFCFRG